MSLSIPCLCISPLTSLSPVITTSLFFLWLRDICIICIFHFSNVNDCMINHYFNSKFWVLKKHFYVKMGEEMDLEHICNYFYKMGSYIHILNPRVFFGKWPYLKKNVVVVECDWYSMLYSFLVYSKVIQLYMYIYFISFSTMIYYRILNIVPCAIQKDPVVYLFYIVVCIC